MTSDRHLALMALMTEIEGPTNAYRHSVRRAAETLSDSPQNLAAIERGNAALLDIEQAVRRWVATHPEQANKELPNGFKRETCITVACTACGYQYDETEFTQHYPSVGDATDGVVGAGWDELKDGRVLCEAQDEKHKELRHTVGVVDDSEA